MPKFDLARELKADPPNPWKPPSVFDKPRVQDWLQQLLELKAQGFAVSFPYIAAKLTKACRAEGLIRPEARITPDAVRKHLERRR